MDQILEFAGNHTLLVGALFLSFFVVTFTELRRQSMGLSSVEPQDAVRLINAEATVLDVRSPETYARGHIVNAKNIPLAELDANLDKIKKYKSIVAVCDAGVSSNQAVNTLRKAGLDNVYGLRGGINAWTQANLPLVTARKTGKKG
jgi:rhodanese-related sulfurtransferase